MVDDMSRESWTPLPFVNVVQGHVNTGAIKCLVYLPLVWLGSIIVPGLAVSFNQLAVVVIIAALVCAIPQTLVFRWFTLREQCDGTANLLCPILEATVTLIIAPIIGYLITQTTRESLMVGIVMASVDLVIELLTRPRDESHIPSREQVADNMEQTRELTQEIFSDEISHVRDEQQRRLDQVNQEHGIDILHHNQAPPAWRNKTDTTLAVYSPVNVRNVRLSVAGEAEWLRGYWNGEYAPHA